MAERVFCGLDLGTTHIKAVVLDGEGKVRALSRTETPLSHDGTGDVHEPEAICAAAESVVCSAIASAGPGVSLASIGTASIGEEGVPLDEDGKVLYPSIAWYDRRESTGQQQWCQGHPEAEFFSVTGMHQDLGLTIFKWLWLRSNRPESWSRCRLWLGLGDYLVWRWTGEAAMMPSHACRTGLFDARELRWRDDWASELVQGRPSPLPPLGAADSIVGWLSPRMFAEIAREKDVAVVNAGHDHIVGAWAAGTDGRGDVLDSMGTAEAILVGVPGDRLGRADPSMGADFSFGVDAANRLMLGGLPSGAGVESWRRSLAGGTGLLEEAAGQVAPGAEGLRYVPPRMRDSTAGAVFGHRVSHGSAQLYRAVLEGWAMAAAMANEAMLPEGRPKRVACIGGGTSSRLWMQIKATVMATPMVVPGATELVAIGAGLLAAKAVSGMGREVLDLSPSTVEPVQEWVTTYAEMREGFEQHCAAVHSRPAKVVYP